MSTEISSLRDSNGLLKTINYEFNTDKTVNWRAMLLREHLYVNPDYEDELKMKFGVKSRREIDVAKCADHELLVLLDGWRYLLKLRGVRSVDIKMDHVSHEKVSATCTIELIGNYETNGEPIRWSDSASASYHNVSGTFQLHLEAIAANRALARCARAILGVKIYGKDEYDPKANKEFEQALKEGKNPLIVESKSLQSMDTPTETVAIKPTDILAKRCRELDKKGSHTFEKIKESSIANIIEFSSDPNTWSGWQDIPYRDVWTLLNKIEETAKKKKS